MEGLTGIDINIAAFYILAGMSITSALIILLSKNIVRAIFLLVLVFVGIAGIYMITKAEFVAVTQILVYVGGILILLMFGVMLTNRIEGQLLASRNKRILPAILVAGLFFWLLSSSVLKNSKEFKANNWAVSSSISAESTDDIEPTEANFSATQSIGINLMTHQVLALEITAVLLLVALVGAAFVVGRKDMEKENE